jgi:6-pyruvoyltetrahydropterin/6-carboxytetrahydropterin synthase
MHGHTYRIRLEVTGKVEGHSGWVIDYADLKYAWSIVKADLDHRCLNDVSGLENSTCELIAAWIAGRLMPGLPGLSRIELRETERCGVVLEVG